MNTKLIILTGVILALATVVVFQTINISTLETENETLTREYGYAIDMLGGFLHDKDSMKEQIKSIRSNPQDTV